MRIRVRLDGVMLLFLILSTVMVNAKAWAEIVNMLEDKFKSLGPIYVNSSSGLLGVDYAPNQVDKEASTNAAYLEATVRKIVDFATITAKGELDPLHLESLNASVLLSNLVVKGLDKFELKNVTIRFYDKEISPETLRADITLAVPAVSANVDYIASLLSTNQIASGYLKAKLNNLQLQIAAQASPNQVYFFDVMQVNSYKMSASADDLKVQLEVDQFPKLENDTKFIRRLLDDSKDEITEYVCHFAVKEANKVLENIPKSILMDLLSASPALLESIIDQVLR